MEDAEKQGVEPSEGAEMPPKSQKELWMERRRSMKKNANPEYNADNENEDDYYSDANKDMDELARLRDNDGKMNQFFDDYPEYSSMMIDAVNGKKWYVSLVERYGKERLQAILDGDVDAEEIADAEAKRQKAEAESKKFLEESEDNLQKSIDNMNAFLEKKGLTPEKEGVKIWNDMVKFTDEGRHGMFSPQFIDMVYKAGNYDTDVAEAKEEGEVKGRNANIEAKLAKSAAPAEIPPALNGGGQKAAENVPPKPKRTYHNPWTGRDEEAKGEY